MKTKYLLVWNDDTIMHTGLVDRMVEQAECPLSPDVVSCGFIEVAHPKSGHSVTWPVHVTKQLMDIGNVVPSMSLIRTASWVDLSENVTRFSDWIAYCTMLGQGRKFSHVPMLGYTTFYNVGSSDLTKQEDPPDWELIKKMAHEALYPEPKNVPAAIEHVSTPMDRKWTLVMKDGTKHNISEELARRLIEQSKLEPANVGT